MTGSTLSVADRTVAERARDGSLTGPELARALAAESDLTGVDLRNVDLAGADLSGVRMFKAELSGASLRGADLSGAELSGADLRGADLEGARCIGVGLGMADLREIQAFEADFTDATLTGANLGSAALRCATLERARMREVELTSADLRSADLRDAELSLSRVEGACFDDADLRGARLRAVTGFESARWYGVDIRDINFAGAYRLRRHVVDENYLREFRESGRVQAVLYRIWRLTSDCGRSIGRWMVVVLAVASAFAAAYAAVGVDAGPHAPGASTYFYYSVVTLTSLGYGDIVPSSTAGQLLAMLEVCVGYVMLGGLISIFANKMARRAE